MKEYFKRDLTDKEEDLLARQLAESPKTSLKFARLAEIAYLQTGLPHVGTRGGGPGHGLGAGGSGATMTLKVLTALVAGGSAVVYFVRTQSPPTIVLQPQATPFVQTQKVIPEITMVQRVTPTIAFSPKTSFLPPSFRGIVQPEAYDPSVKYEGLDLVIERKTTGLVTLRVLDANKNEIRLLYVGLLKPGQWRFQWDGKQEKGGWVPPGNYQIQVLSGAITLTKQIAIRSETDLTQNH